MGAYRKPCQPPHLALLDMEPVSTPPRPGPWLPTPSSTHHHTLSDLLPSPLGQECAVLLEMLNRDVPEPFLEHCRGVGSGTSGASAGGGAGGRAPTVRQDTPDDIAGQIAVIKKFEKTLR